MYHDQQNIYIQIKSTFIPINHPQEIKKNLMQYLQQGRIHATYDGLEILSNYTTITVPITQEHKQWINKKAIETGKTQSEVLYDLLENAIRKENT